MASEDVEQYKSMRCRDKGTRTKRLLKPASINRELACGKAMFTYWGKSDERLPNPFRKVRFLAENNEQTRVVGVTEFNKYLAEASQPLRGIAVLMLETGMRREEVYGLTRKNVLLGETKLFIPHGKTKAARRKVTLTARATEVVKERLAQAEGEYLFPHEKDPNQPMLKVNNAHDGAVRRSKVAPFRLYDVRHTFATRAVESGMDLVTLAAVLGHSRIQMVLRYAHPTEQHQGEAIRKLERFNAAAEIAAYEKKGSLAILPSV